MNMTIERVGAIPSATGFETRRKLLFQLKTIGASGSKVPLRLIDENGDYLVFGDSRILIKKYIPPQP